MNDGTKRLWCKIFGHKLRVVQVFSPSSRKCECARCDTYFAMEDKYQAFLEWDSDFEDLYANVYGFGRTIR